MLKERKRWLQRDTHLMALGHGQKQRWLQPDRWQLSLSTQQLAALLGQLRGAVRASSPSVSHTSRACRLWCQPTHHTGGKMAAHSLRPLAGVAIAVCQSGPQPVPFPGTQSFSSYISPRFLTQAQTTFFLPFVPHPHVS